MARVHFSDKPQSQTHTSFPHRRPLGHQTHIHITFHFDFIYRSTSLTVMYLNSEDRENTLNSSISLRVGFSRLLYVAIVSWVQ